MSPQDDEGRCIALTKSGNRCTRTAEDGQFCYQHDETDPTIDERAVEEEGVATEIDESESIDPAEAAEQMDVQDVVDEVAQEAEQALTGDRDDVDVDATPDEDTVEVEATSEDDPVEIEPTDADAGTPESETGDSDDGAEEPEDDAGREVTVTATDDADGSTVDNETRRKGLLSIVSDRIQFQTQQLVGAQRDLTQNIEAVVEGTGQVTGSIASLDFLGAVEAVGETVERTTPTPAKHAVSGGVGGSAAGPIGTAAGTTAGAWYGVYKVLGDDRAIGASVVDDLPDDADVVSADHEAIADVEPVQVAIENALEARSGSGEWLRTTLFRDRRMDAVEARLDRLPVYRTVNGTSHYYVEHEDSGETLLVLFGKTDQ